MTRLDRDEALIIVLVNRTVKTIKYQPPPTPLQSFIIRSHECFLGPFAAAAAQWVCVIPVCSFLLRPPHSSRGWVSPLPSLLPSVCLRLQYIQSGPLCFTIRKRDLSSKSAFSSQHNHPYIPSLPPSARDAAPVKWVGGLCMS